MTRFALPALALPALVLVLTACQPAPPQQMPDPGTPDGRGLAACGGGPVRALLGQSVAALPASGGWTALRVITPGMAVTEEYSSSRLNVTVDALGLIIGLTCG